MLLAKVAVPVPEFKKVSSSTQAEPFQRRVVLVAVPATGAKLSTQLVLVPVVLKICPSVPALPKASTKAALRVVVLLAVKVPLAVVLAPTYRSAVSVVLPVTSRVPVTVVLAARVAVPVPASVTNKAAVSTHWLPSQRKVELVTVPVGIASSAVEVRRYQVPDPAVEGWFSQ